MTRRAVVYYEVGATDKEKIAALRSGIEDCVLELAELGVSLDDIERACDSACSAVEWSAA